MTTRTVPRGWVVLACTHPTCGNQAPEPPGATAWCGPPRHPRTYPMLPIALPTTAPDTTTNTQGGTQQ